MRDFGGVLDLAVVAAERRGEPARSHRAGHARLRPGIPLQRR